VIRPGPADADADERTATMRAYGNYLRWLYAGGRPNWFARLQNRASARVFAAGIMPGRCAELRIRGRRTGRVISLPVVVARYEDGRYLVSMLGDDVNWVRNLRADHGAATLVHGRREQVRLEEVSVSERAPIIRRYLQVAPGARPHIPVARGAPLADFERISQDYPVFRIRPAA
jgi:F420H(2)-dependent quinone reductase